MTRRVVVTGLGAISSIGIGWRDYWSALLAGKSGISEISSFDTTDFLTHRGGEVNNFKADNFVQPRTLRKINRASQFAIAATKMAIEDAKLDLSTIELRRAGIALGTTMAEAQAIETMDSLWVSKGARSITARLAAQYPGSMIAAHVAAELGSNLRCLVIATACAAGNYALSYAYDLIRLGKVDLVFAGGSDAFSRIAFMGFNRLLAVAPDRCQPFDKYRKGMMVGEGAGILLLEEMNHARQRGAEPYAEVLGYGLTCDAHHMTIPDKDGVMRVMNAALHDARVSAKQVSYISAHGTGTPANDRTESAAIRSVFADHADKVPISSIKSMLGHTMGAASALEAIACVLALRFDMIPPTINFETPDPECAIDCVPNKARSQPTNIVLNNSFAFGGNNACVVFGKN